MPKNIVILSDGTGQEGGRGRDTNIYKLFRMLEDRTDRQIVFYDGGIGTDQHKILGSVAGAGFAENLLQCYQFIYENYNARDKIYLFGFSRGAATVRSLASFIHYFGLLPKSRPELIKKAYELYRVGREVQDDSNVDGSSLNKHAENFVHEHPNQWASIEFLGVWDTVPALGLPGAVIDTFVNYVPGWRHRYHDFKLHPSVRNAYHALSIDDDRKWFHPTIWDSYNEEKQKVDQVWFSGSHTDVGGGFREPALSDIVLEWMVQKAVAHGVKLYLRSKQNWNFCIAPDSTDEWHPPRSGAGTVYPAKQRTWPVGAENTFGVPKIHASVLERAKHVEEYRPWIIEKYGNLKKNGATESIEADYPEDKIEPWVKEFEYQHNENEAAEMISLRDYDRDTWEETFNFINGGPGLLNSKEDDTKLLERGKWSGDRLDRDLERWKKAAQSR